MTSLLSPSDKETVTTVTKLEIEVQRTETVTLITCSQCSRTGEVRKVEFTPPASVGSAVASCRVPDGWWVQGASYFNFKGTCPDCFEQRSSGVVRSLSDDSEDVEAADVEAADVAAASARLEVGPEDAAEADLTSLDDRPSADSEPPAIVAAPSRAPGQDSSYTSVARDLFERVERVCEHGGSVLVSGSSTFRETTRRAYVKLSNDHGIDLTASATGRTLVAALESALGKAGL